MTKLNSKEIYKSWPKWKRDIQIGKINAKSNSMTKVYTIKSKD